MTDPLSTDPPEVAGPHPRGAAEVDVRSCPAGPLLVRGATTIRDADGRSHAVARPVVAVCRCGKSSRAPWCDGTHKLLPPSLRPA